MPESLLHMGFQHTQLLGLRLLESCCHLVSGERGAAVWHEEILVRLASKGNVNDFMQNSQL